MLTLAPARTRYLEVWAREATEEGLSLGHMAIDVGLAAVMPAGLAAQVVEYPLDEAYSLVVLLPSSALGLPRLLAALAAEPGRWAVWSGALRERPVSLRLPAFRLEAGESHGRPLRAMGLAAAFEPPGGPAQHPPFGRASDAPLALENLYVSSVVELSAAPPAEGEPPPAAASKFAAAPLSVAAGRPFLFFVVDVASGLLVVNAQVASPQLLGLGPTVFGA